MRPRPGPSRLRSGGRWLTFMEQAGGNPGRSGHRLSVAAGRVVYDTREALAELFHAEDPLRVILSPNVTYALNLALLGLLSPGDGVVTTGIEHNSVMRPLRSLEASGIEVIVVPCGSDGRVDLQAMSRAIGGRRHAGGRQSRQQRCGNASRPWRRSRAWRTRRARSASSTRRRRPAYCPSMYRPWGSTCWPLPGTRVSSGQPARAAWSSRPASLPERFRPAFTGGTGSRSEEELPPEMFPDRLEPGHAERRWHRRSWSVRALPAGQGRGECSASRGGADRAAGRRTGADPRGDAYTDRSVRRSHGHGVDPSGWPARLRGGLASGQEFEIMARVGSALLAGDSPHAGHLSGGHGAIWRPAPLPLWMRSTQQSPRWGRSLRAPG